MTAHEKTDAVDAVTTLMLLVFCLLFGASLLMWPPYTGALPTHNPLPQVRVRTISPEDEVKAAARCALNDGNAQECVRGQQTGDGCSWYAACSKCIWGSHIGKTYAQLCGEER